MGKNHEIMFGWRSTWTTAGKQQLDGDQNGQEQCEISAEVKTRSWLLSGRDTPTTCASDWLQGEKTQFLIEFV